MTANASTKSDFAEVTKRRSQACLHSPPAGIIRLWLLGANAFFNVAKNGNEKNLHFFH
jgi:hypothetical protein